MKIPLAVALTTSILYIICVILVSMPGGLTLFSYLFHGIDITQIASSGLNVVNVIIGLIEAFVLAYIVGWLYVAIKGKGK